MIEEPEYIDELIAKYLAGEASADERVAVEQWITDDVRNREHFRRSSVIFEGANAAGNLREFDTDAAWIKVKANLNKEKGRQRFMSSPKFYWQIAASVALIALAFWYLYNPSKSTGEQFQSVTVVAENTAKSDTLPEGSNVFLNKQSVLNYSFDKEEKVHRVTLRGEAYFAIEHHPEKKFVVDLNGIFVRDIGTSFNVKAYPNQDVIEVIVEHGEVQFYSENNPGVYLKPGGKGVYDKKKKSFTIENPEANVLAYKTKLFVFNDTDLRTVARTLNDIYNKKIHVGPNLDSCRVTVSFKNESVEEIAAVISETLSLTVTESQDTLHLNGPGCATAR